MPYPLFATVPFFGGVYRANSYPASELKEEQQRLQKLLKGAPKTRNLHTTFSQNSSQGALLGSI
ncbi:hypothetical protein BA171_07955 [Candidatus Hamiltonella defensa (Bemisia tabaci)]|uniref:Uncharacterized protein n=1 Tax=Candidatus Hamiltonella defensa (Bemisia tabaci) TaxID=672795 RepID=A0A249E075_9ENTR|nr:hypothetical protein BA171_07955 [Candidatus Hamiltonella defensa (Bemisia tabaci)]